MSRSSLALRCRGQIALIALAVTVTGCSAGEPRPVETAGVDGLEIPTPSPDPADFVDVIDNRYLPLAAGSRWVYEQTASSTTVTVTVTGATTRIAGVEATEVLTVVAASQGAAEVEPSTGYYAQDDDGNVWSFGGDGWEAGVDGAQAGLVMPATPRVGDGFQQQDAAGVAEGRSQVLDTAASASTPYGSWTDLVEVLETSGLTGETETHRFYAPGVGLVRTESAAGLSALVSYTLDGPAP